MFQTTLSLKLKICKEHQHTGSEDFAFGNDVLLVPKSTFYITLQLYFSKQIVSAFIHTVYLVDFFSVN